LRTTLEFMALVLAVLAAASPLHVQPVVGATQVRHFSSSQALVLKKSGFPHGYRYRSSSLSSTVEDWDQGDTPILAIDRKNGWMEATEETAFDATKHDVIVSVQLFRSPTGAKSDFGQFFTNAHPQSRFLPEAYWLGGKAVHGLGAVATLYHMSYKISRCPAHLTAGLSFAFGNAIFSVTVCTRSAGDKGARDLANRLFAQSKKVSALH
jgi:hypothetical protein